jgi:hypothetical protein
MVADVEVAKVGLIVMVMAVDVVEVIVALRMATPQTARTMPRGMAGT